MDKEINNSQDIKNAMAFVPLLAFIFYFIDNDKTARFTKNLKYAMILFLAYIIFSIIFVFFLYGILVLAYLWISWYLWYMAYNWNDVKIDFLDKIIESFEINKK